MSALMAELSPSSMACVVALTSAVMSPLLAGVEGLLPGAALDVDVALRAVESRESRSLSEDVRSPLLRSVPSWLSSFAKAVELAEEDAMFESREVVIPLAEVVEAEDVAPTSASCVRVT